MVFVIYIFQQLGKARVPHHAFLNSNLPGRPHRISLELAEVELVRARLLSPLKCFFQLSMLFKPGASLG